MRTLIAAATVAVLLAGCQSATSTTNPATPGKNNFKYGTGDGETMTTAVEIRTHSEFDGGVMIKEWIRMHYPGFAITEQEVMEQRDRAYNMITIVNPSNTSHRVYFDISSYYRRIGNDTFPRPIS